MQPAHSFAFTPAIALAGGAWVFLAFIIIFTVAVIYGLYSQRGSGIPLRPYGNVYGGAPAARGASSMSGRDRPISNLTRGTR